MNEGHSRRALMKAGLATAAIGALPMLVSADVPTASDIEKDLGHAMPDEAKKLLRAALDNNANNAKERLKTRLPDCSEPCFGYRASGVQK